MNLMGKRASSMKLSRPVQQVREAMQIFIEAHAGLDLCYNPGPEQGLIYLLYMYGAVDKLCDSLEIDRQEMQALFEILLENELGEYSQDEVDNLMRIVIDTSTKPSGMHIMNEGAVSVSRYVSEEALFPDRVHKLFVSASNLRGFS